MLFRYTGATSGVWTLAANWVDAAGNAVTGYPGDTAGRLDDAVFDQTAANALVGATLVNPLGSLRICTGYNKDFASSSSYMILQAAYVSVDAAMNVYLQGGDGNGIQSIYALGSRSTNKIYLKGNLANPIIMEASVSISAATITGTFNIKTSTSSAFSTTIAAGVTLPDNITTFGGSVTNANAISGANGRLSIMGGSWTQNAGDVTNADVFAGTFAWNGGNLTTLNAYGGSTTAAGGTSTRRVNDINLYENASVDLDNGGNVHITGHVTDLGGTLKVADGCKLEEYKPQTYAGVSDTVLGIAAQSLGPNATINGSDIYLGLYDKLDVYVTVGATDTAVTCTLYECADPSTHGGEAAIAAPAPVTFTDTDDNKTQLMTLWGYQLSAGKSNVRAKITTGASGANAIVGVLYIKHSA